MQTAEELGINPPVFCPECRTLKTFKHLETADIISDTGKTMWQNWGCSDCPYTTIIPLKDNL